MQRLSNPFPAGGVRTQFIEGIGQSKKGSTLPFIHGHVGASYPVSR